MGNADPLMGKGGVDWYSKPGLFTNFQNLVYLFDITDNFKLLQKAGVLWRTAALGCSLAGEGACSPLSFFELLVI
ncbi:MAG: hypothetical protein ACHQX0_07005 [Desulfobaccales bacterium]